MLRPETGEAIQMVVFQHRHFFIDVNRAQSVGNGDLLL